MEFGIMHLPVITKCLIIVIPTLGFILLAIIRFRLKDTQIARNILFTIIGAGIIAFLFPIFEFFRAVEIMQHSCAVCDATIDFTPTILGRAFLDAIKLGALLIFPGIGFGFVFAFGVIVPITLGVRSSKKGSSSSQQHNYQESDQIQSTNDPNNDKNQRDLQS